MPVSICSLFVVPPDDDRRRCVPSETAGGGASCWYSCFQAVRCAEFKFVLHGHAGSRLLLPNPEYDVIDKTGEEHVGDKEYEVHGRLLSCPARLTGRCRVFCFCACVSVECASHRPRMIARKKKTGLAKSRDWRIGSTGLQRCGTVAFSPHSGGANPKPFRLNLLGFSAFGGRGHGPVPTPACLIVSGPKVSGPMMIQLSEAVMIAIHRTGSR